MHLPPFLHFSVCRMTYPWEDDEATKETVAAMQGGATVETRVLLKPIFRWAKREPEKAHAYVVWLLQLYTHGDSARAIAAQPTLQADYAINTLITASQRCGKAVEAERAFSFLSAHNFVPDVFAFTALIDVLGRCGRAEIALARYNEMLETGVEPNIVTFTTVLRVLAMSTAVDARVALDVLNHAKARNAVDPSLYTEALDMCAKRLDLALAANILALRRDDGGLQDLLVDRTVYAMGRALRKLDARHVVDEWLAAGLIHAGDKDALAFGKAGDGDGNGGKATGCLGYETPASVRQSVIRQDIQKLMTRGVQPTRYGPLRQFDLYSSGCSMDFETLIHQCRKRKWKDEIASVFDAMQRLSAVGWDDGVPAPLPPQPSVAPTASTYLALIDAYICCGAPASTWAMFADMDAHRISRTQAIVRKYIRGSYLALKDATDDASPADWHVPDVVALALRDGIPITQRMAMNILRMYGSDHAGGLAMLATLEHSALGTRTLFDELVQACVYAHNVAGAIAVWDAFQASDAAMPTTATIERIMLLACFHHATLPDALAALHAHQAARRLVSIPTYASIVHEFFVKYTLHETMNASGLAKALKVLYERRALFEFIQDHAVALSRHGHDNIVAVPCGLAWSTSIAPHVPAVAPLLFAQHVHERFTIVRDKAAKNDAERATKAALEAVDDPLLFVVHALLAFPKLDISFRVQAKFAKQLFALIADSCTPQPHHAHHCLAHLDSMSMYLMQELDAMFHLAETDQLKIAAFCARSVTVDHHPEKTLNFVVARPAFFDAASADMLIPAFAELYAQGVTIVLRYLRQSQDLPHARHLPLTFARHVDSLRDDYPDADLRPVVKEFALFELDEFAHVLLNAHVPRAPKPVDPSIDYWSLPLPRDAIVFVDSPETVELAARILLASPVVGWDVEWRPDSYAVRKSKCSIIQLASASHVFICDVLHHWTDAMQALLEAIVTSSTQWKVGFGLAGDLDRMRASFPEVGVFESMDEWENVLDLQTHWKATKKQAHTPGLSRCCQDVLHRPLNKSQQTSDWEQRPLSEDQLLYAANDASCLLALVDALKPPIMVGLWP
ncbi:Aste57867_9435 [Aphanomyces stellatus]|uniref:Aste57867_9435 protein n=1 Tax=Aphanomyces stellatus TaxID=120398 RepID=A0A485KMZ2_9STRA|nr:hypothetical protein As57867_009399 [Aphanomyces stellatus]VFT86315.1 Aste57867_9435 [Aphanomyces stellatus]